ncbi:serine/threonine-protein kinase PknK [Haliangium sp.]|uniref:serine/threonine-protein kinase n=1 Tax=Haliangium sp. TaxID=2663208 RepID=UPI003D0D31AA
MRVDSDDVTESTLLINPRTAGSERVDTLLQPGQRIDGRYRVERWLGGGGMGEVYEVTCEPDGERLALKALRRSRHDRAGLDAGEVRFRREYRTARRMRHPACMRAYTMGYADGIAYFTMRLLEGGSLRPACDAGLPPASAVHVALQVLTGLDHLHAHNVIHRDLKPRNILLSAPLTGPEAAGHGLPEVVLSDFGISKVGDFDDSIRLDQVFGSMRYLAPELVLGQPADPRSDLYMLGIVLYELLTGTHPLDAPDELLGWFKRQIERPPNPLPSEVPTPIAELVAELLAKDPNARPRTAAQVHGRLSAWLARSGASWLARSGASPTPAAPAPALEGRPYLAGPRLVGRESALATVSEFLDAALDPALDDHHPGADSPLILSISGPAGTGKSRLLQSMMPELSSRGARVLVGVGSRDSARPFACLAGLLDALARVDPSEPHLSQTMTHAHGGGPGDAPLSGAALTAMAARELDRDMFLREVGKAILMLARRGPFVVVVDDAQWIDPESLELLDHLLRTVHAEQSDGAPVRVAVILSRRPSQPDDRSARLDEPLAAIQHRVRAIQLAPLGSDHVAQLCGALLMQPGSRELAAFSQAVFGGRPCTPLYVAQVLRLLLMRGTLIEGTRDEHGRWRGTWNLAAIASGTDLPRTVQDAIGERATRLSVRTQTVLSTAAVVGRRCDADVLAHACELADEEFLECLDEAIATGFLAVEAGGVHEHAVEAAARAGAQGSDSGTAPAAWDQRRGWVEQIIFVHDRHRDALFDALSEPDRRHVHGRLARAIVACRGDDPAASAELARHSIGTGDLDQGYRQSLRGARFATRSQAYSGAAELYVQAFALADRMGRRVAVDERHAYADLCCNLGRFTDARAAYQRCIEDGAEGQQRLTILGKEAFCDHRSGDYRGAAEPLEALAESFGLRIPEGLLHSVLGTATSALSTVTIGLLPTLVRRHPHPDRERGEVVLECWLDLTETYAWMNFRRALYCAMGIAPRAARLGPSRVSSRAFSMVAFFLAAAGASRLARRYAEIAVMDLSEYSDSYRARVYGGCAGAYSMSGHPEASRACALDGIAGAVAGGDIYAAFIACAFACPSLCYLGRFQDSLAVARQMAKVGQRHRHDQMFEYAHLYEAHVRMTSIADIDMLALYDAPLRGAEERKDRVAELWIRGHRSLARALRGQPIDCDDTIDMIRNQIDSRFNSPINPLSAALAALALEDLARPLPARTRATIDELRRKAWMPCNANATETATYLAATGALALARGRRRQAARRFRRAVRVAEAQGMKQPVCVVQWIAARAYGSDSREGSRYRRQAEALDHDMKQHPPSPRLFELLASL